MTDAKHTKTPQPWMIVAAKEILGWYGEDGWNRETYNDEVRRIANTIARNEPVNSAVNAHDKLVEALQGAQAEFEEMLSYAAMEGTGAVIGPVECKSIRGKLQQARAALADLEGK